jgi:hypothetical protein
MNNSYIKEFISELEYRIAVLEVETRVRGYCKGKGLDPEKASDYARAAIAVIEYVTPGPLRRRPHFSNIRDGKLPYSNNSARKTIDTYESGIYNNDEILKIITGLADRVAILEKSCYGGWKELLKDVGKDVWRSIKGRSNIINNSGTQILVVGNDEGKSQFAMFLEDGDLSDKYFYDTDGLIIVRGQKFYRPGSNEVVTTGAIKISDGFTGEVTNENGILKVSGHTLEYYDTPPAGWPTSPVLPGTNIEGA